jgi:hypothetical protein
MSLKALPIPPVPEETAHVARAVFPRGNVLMQLRDTLGTIYTDEAFADLFPTHGQPALAAWRLALVTLFQSGVNQAIAWTWLAPRSKRIGIKRKLDMISRTSVSIGKRRPLPAHRAERVRAGPRSKMQANRSSR